MPKGICSRFSLLYFSFFSRGDSIRNNNRKREIPEPERPPLRALHRLFSSPDEFVLPRLVRKTVNNAVQYLQSPKYAAVRYTGRGGHAPLFLIATRRGGAIYANNADVDTRIYSPLFDRFEPPQYIGIVRI